MSVEHFSQVITLCRSAWAANLERPAELQTDDLMKKLTPFDVQSKIAILLAPTEAIHTHTPNLTLHHNYNKATNKLNETIFICPC